MKHPVTQTTQNIFIYITVWVIIFIVHTSTLNVLYHLPFLNSIIDAAIFNAIFGGLGLALWYPVFYQNIENHTLGSLVINHISIMILTLLFWIGVGVFLLKTLFADNADYIHFIENGIPWRVYTGVFYYMAIILFYYLLIYEHNLKDHIIQESRLKEKINEAELNALKSQINPHFLFNSLNSISSLTITNPEKAHQMIIMLSGFLRYSLAHDPTKLIPLKQELDNMEAYVAVEKERFGDKLIFMKDIELVCESIMVPFLILQPLIENAIKHGVYESMQPIEVRVSCQKIDEKNIRIQVINGFDPEAVSRKGTGTGLKNIKERLKIIYQMDDLFTVQKRANEFEVTLVLPCKAAFK